MKHTLVNIPDPNNPYYSIVGIRIDESHEAWGKMGLSEPCTWLTKQLECGQNSSDFTLYGYATPSGKLYASGMLAAQAGEQRFVKVYVNKEDLK
jgi:hypothetical protein